MQNPHEALQNRGLYPKQSLGQNFLISKEIARRIADAAAIMPGDTILEIGPGTGMLTAVLAERAARVVAVEIDAHFMPILEEALAAYPNVVLHHGDILETDLARLIIPPYKVVANVPYYITGAITRFLLEDAPFRPARLTLTVQKELADRVAAAPGDMSLYAVSVQVYGKVKIAMRLKAGSFWPRPDVDSAVITLDTYDDLPWGVDAAKILKMAKAGFAQRRKQLKNTLSANSTFTREEVVAALESAGIKRTIRAEKLSIPEWAALTRALYEQV